MKAKFDFKNMMLEERNIVENFLQMMLLSDFTFTNNVRAYDSNKDRLTFKINDYYFSISFDKISYQDEMKILNTLLNINKSNLTIKRIPNFSLETLAYEKEFKSCDKTIYFSSTNDISLLKQELKVKNFEQICEKSYSLNKTFNVSLSLTLLVKDIKKQKGGELSINLNNNAILFSSALKNQIFCSTFEVLEDRFVFTLKDDNKNLTNSIKNGEQEMENENLNNNNDEIEVKGELYIGSVDIDIKKLLSLKAGDKIVLDKEDNITSILKIGSKEVLTGKLEFDEKNIKFIVESSNF